MDNDEYMYYIYIRYTRIGNKIMKSLISGLIYSSPWIAAATYGVFVGTSGFNITLVFLLAIVFFITGSKEEL